MPNVSAPAFNPSPASATASNYPAQNTGLSAGSTAFTPNGGAAAFNANSNSFTPTTPNP